MDKNKSPSQQSLLDIDLDAIVAEGKKQSKKKMPILVVATIIFVVAVGVLGYTIYQYGETVKSQEIISGTGEGFQGDIVAELTIRGNQVVELRLIGEDENGVMGKTALPELAKRIVAAHGLDGVDGVAGATLTSNGIFEAVNAAIDSRDLLWDNARISIGK